MSDRVVRVGDTKVKKFSIKDNTISLHKKLLEGGLELPKILKLETNAGIVTKTSEWVPGKTFDELKKENNLTLADWSAFGEFFAKMNNLGVSSKDLVVQNILRKEDGSVIICDLDTLFESDYPEQTTIRWIFNNIYYPIGVKEAFLAGYNKHRLMTEEGLLQKEISVNYDGYQDLYLRNKLIRRGVRSNKRLDLLEDNFGGKDILDVGCSSGAMFARHAAWSGAHSIMAVDKITRGDHCNLVDLPAYISYLEGLCINFNQVDIENVYFKQRVENTKWHIIFFCAMLGHLKGDREVFVKWLASLTKILYFETNLGGNKEQAELFLDKIGFSNIKCLGESGDPDRDPNNHYVMYRCETRGE